MGAARVDVVTLTVKWCSIMIFIAGTNEEEVRAYLNLINVSVVRVGTRSNANAYNVDFTFPEDRLAFTVAMKNEDISSLVFP